MSYAAYITTIKELHKHSNADRLMCTTIYGANVIVGLNYEVGQRCVYFPIDGALSKQFAEENNLVRKLDESGKNIGGYLEEGKYNIRALKLRGEKSEGLLLPIETLDKYMDTTQLKEGDKIQDERICTKYIPHSQIIKPLTTKKRFQPRTTMQFPNFEEHVDTEQLQLNRDKLKKGDYIIVTEKVHGTSGRTANTLCVEKKECKVSFLRKFIKPKQIKSYKVTTGTRRVVLGTNFEGGYYGDNEFRKPYHVQLSKILPPNVEIFYEIAGYLPNGKPIMPEGNNKKLNDKNFVKQYGEKTTFSYGCERGQSRMFIYRMKYNDGDYEIEIPWAQVQRFCTQNGLDAVPVLDSFIYDGNFEHLMERIANYVGGPSTIDSRHTREGVVLRVESAPSFLALKEKNFEFKVLEGLIKESATVADIEEAQELQEGE